MTHFVKGVAYNLRCDRVVRGEATGQQIDPEGRLPD